MTAQQVHVALASLKLLNVRRAHREEFAEAPDAEEQLRDTVCHTLREFLNGPGDVPLSGGETQHVQEAINALEAGNPLPAHRILLSLLI